MTKDEKRAQHAAYMQKYTAENSEKINAQRRARRNNDTLTVEKEWKAKNKDRVREYKKRDSQKRAKAVALYARAWRLRNQESITKTRGIEYAANKTTIAARLEKHRKENPEHYKEKQHLSVMRRRARLAKVEQEPINRSAIYERDGGVCGICHRKVSARSFSLDHIWPLSKGGPHKRSNIRLAHTICNKRRGNRGPGQTVLDL